MPLPQDLINAAVRGFTENQLPYRAQLPPSPHSSIARLLLDAARLSYQIEAAYQPRRSLAPLPKAILNSEYPTCGYQAQQHLKLMLNGDYKILLPQWLELLAEFQKRLPDELLPSLLDYGNKTTEMQATLRTALGRRGLWLQEQAANPNWDWIYEKVTSSRQYESDYDAWRDYLIQQREKDPHTARELLIRHWQALDPMMQLVLLKAFETGLVPADAPFLESLLEDESCRIFAARLLVKISDCDFAQEFFYKLGRLLTLTQMGHRKQWVIDYAWSMAFDKHSTQISRSAAQELCSIKGHEFNPELMVMIAPLSYWYDTYRVTGSDLVEAARNSTQPTMFQRTWTSMAIETQDEAFLYAIVLTQSRYSQSVARALSPEQKETAAFYWFEKYPRFSAEHGVVPLLLVHTTAWTERLGQRFLKALEAGFRGEARPLLDSKLRNHLNSIVLYFPLSLRDEFARIIHINERGDLSESEEEQASALLHLLDFRSAMIAALESDL